MLKICPICRRTWSGGRDCPHCGEGHPLIDVAEPQGRKTFLRDKDLAAAIRGYYGARTGMLIAFWGILLGLVAALILSGFAGLAEAAAIAVAVLIRGSYVPPEGNLLRAAQAYAALGVFTLTSAAFLPLTGLGLRGRRAWRWVMLACIWYSYVFEVT